MSPLPTVVQFAAQHSIYCPAMAALLGVLIGSFLNVIISRVPAGESIVTPRSHCKCGAPIPWRFNVPVISWAALRGRARCCGDRISFRYPLVELATGLLFLGAWLRLSPPVALIAWGVIGFLVCATWIDLDHLIIPDGCSLGLAAFGFLASLAVPALQGCSTGNLVLDRFHAGIQSFEGLCLGSGLIFWIGFSAELILRKEAIGFGDVKLLGAIGACCGMKGAIFALFGGSLLGALGLVAFAIATMRRPNPERIALGIKVPFGPMLSAGAIGYMLFVQQPLADWITRNPIFGH